MANSALVFVYSDDSAEWLRERGYACPAVRHGNEMPTTGDMKWALHACESLVYDIPSGEQELDGTDEQTGDGFCVAGFDWDEDHTIPGDSSSAAASYTSFPESDEPAIILDESLNSEDVLDLWREAEENGRDWGYFYDQLYGG